MKQVKYPLIVNKYGIVENINGSSWVNPDKDKLMYDAGFRTEEEMIAEGTLDVDLETEEKLKKKYENVSSNTNS